MAKDWPAILVEHKDRFSSLQHRAFKGERVCRGCMGGASRVGSRRFGHLGRIDRMKKELREGDQASKNHKNAADACSFQFMQAGEGSSSPTSMRSSSSRSCFWWPGPAAPQLGARRERRPAPALRRGGPARGATEGAVRGGRGVPSQRLSPPGGALRAPAVPEAAGRGHHVGD